MHRVLFAGLIVAIAAPASADDEPSTYTPPEFLSVTPPLPAGIDTTNVWRLDLAETLRVAVRQNLDVVLERKSVEAADLGVTVANGPFEPTVSANYQHDSLRTPPTSLQAGMAGEVVTNIDDIWHTTIGQRLAPGTTLTLDWFNIRAKSTSGTAVEPLTYNSALALTVTQPLARGFSTDLAIPQVDVLRAKIASDRERKQLEVRIADVVQRAETAYWDVLLALYHYDLALRTHKAAADQMALTRRQIDAGTLPSSDAISAESTLAQRQLELVSAEEQIHAAWDALRNVMHVPRAQWSRPILPTDVPRFTPGGTSVDDAFAVALDRRPELAQLALDLKAAALATRKAENDKLPQLDLSLTGTLFGQDAQYGDALSQLSSTDARGWTVVLSFAWTPLRRATGATAAIAKLQQEQTVLRREAELQQVWAEVRDAVRNQVGAARRVRAAAKFRGLAEKSLEIEQRKFLNGTSQNLFVAQRQDAVAQAQLAELDALLAHTRAQTTLFKATGQLLTERHIELR